MPGSKRKPERLYYMLPEEFKKFLTYAYQQSPVYGFLYELTANAGFRISETLSLTPESFDFEHNVIKILTLKQRHPDEANSLDELSMPEHIMKIAQKYIQIMKIKKDQRLFKFGRHSCWETFKIILRKAGMDTRYSPHALRHLHGIIITEITGGDMMAVAKRLRHRNPKMAYRYFHLTEKFQKKIVDGLADKLKRDNL